MKNLIKVALFCIILFTFYACPLGLDYPIAEPGKVQIDEDLIGIWKNKDPEATLLKIKISKKDNFSYEVQVLEKSELYALETDNFSAWTSNVEGQKILYFKPSNEDQYYHYVIKELKGKNLITCDLSLLDEGKDAVTSIEALRKEAISSMKMEEFCTETENWTKE
jgi:hypothetical protein